MEYFFADRIWNNTWDILPSGVIKSCLSTNITSFQLARLRPGNAKHTFLWTSKDSKQQVLTCLYRSS